MIPDETRTGESPDILLFDQDCQYRPIYPRDSNIISILSGSKEGAGAGTMYLADQFHGEYPLDKAASIVCTQALLVELFGFSE